MYDKPKIRLELDIVPQTLMQQLVLHNESLEQEIERGVKAAIDELFEEDNLINYIKQQTKVVIKQTVSDAVNNRKLRTVIEQTIHEKVANQISDYAKRVADDLIKGL